MKNTLIPIFLLLMALAMISGQSTERSSSASISFEKNLDDSAIVCVAREAIAVDTGKHGCGGNRSSFLMKSKKNK